MEHLHDMNASGTDAPEEQGPGNGRDPDFWYSLIAEKAAGEFLDLTVRGMQAMRQRGGGPPYVRVSARCIRYRRADLRAWAEKRLRKSTSDPGDGQPEPAPAAAA